MVAMTEKQTGYIALVLSPIFLGLSPIFGKLVLQGGTDPFTVATMRNVLVSLILWLFYVIFWRQYIYIYPAGLMACIAIGVTNGIGSIFYYAGLDKLDASVAQLLNGSYLAFVLILTRLAGGTFGTRTISRVAVATFGVFLITGGLSGNSTWLGIGLMTGNALLFAGTVVMSQRILYEMPARTVTLYVMTAMASVVLIFRLLYGIYNPLWPSLSTDSALALAALTVTMALSRLFLFSGIKGVGSLKTALVAIAETAVAVSAAFIILDESLNLIQWSGVAALTLSLFMPTDEIVLPDGRHMALPNVAGSFSIDQMAFSKAFREKQSLTTQERDSLQLILGQEEKFSTLEMNQLSGMLSEETIRLMAEHLKMDEDKPSG
jgi:drug/metabolite transporter (DMT)-like permease